MKLIYALLFLLYSNVSYAMICHDMRNPYPYGTYNINEVTGATIQMANPMNKGQAYRDPTGQFYMRIPAANPAIESYFSGWDGSLILLNIYAGRPQIIGRCEEIIMSRNTMRYEIPPLTESPYQLMTIDNYPSYKIPKIPEQFISNPSYFLPGYANEKEIMDCMKKFNKNEDQFIKCSIGKLFNKEQTEIYKCMSEKKSDKNLLTQCIAGQLLPPKERKIINKVISCNQKIKGNWEKMPLCLEDLPFDETTQRTIGCMKEQITTGETSPWKVAACVAMKDINVNYEAAAAVQCAVVSGGEPMTWVGCTGGELTKAELTKCFTHGVGGDDGCFGKNNTIMLAVDKVGEGLNDAFGKDSQIAKTFNNSISDITKGPGSNNTIIKTLNNVKDDLENGPGENHILRKSINQIFPGIW